MLIADAQVHVWGDDTPHRPWPKDRTSKAHRTPALGADELIGMMDAAGVDRAVLVPPSWEGDRNDLAIAAVKHHPGRFAIMGRLPLDDPGSRAALGLWKRQPGMLGMRFTFHTPEQRAWLTDGSTDWLWEECEKFAIPLMVFPPGSLDLFDGIAAKYPGLRLVIDHIGHHSHGPKGLGAYDDMPNLLALAKRPNVAVKVSGTPGMSEQGYPYRDVHQPIRQTFDAFGPERTFWGTDITRLPCTYRQAVTMFTEELPWLKGRDLDLVMGEAICNWLGWKLP